MFQNFGEPICNKINNSSILNKTVDNLSIREFNMVKRHAQVTSLKLQVKWKINKLKRVVRKMLMDRELVSVIIPAYNVDKFLGEVCTFVTLSDIYELYDCYYR